MAANKKYLSLEEAASLLKIKTEELIRLREKSEIRGFADRGTWKFKADDVEEFRRRHQPDSDPDVSLMDDDGAFGASGSALDDGDDLGHQATVIRKGREMASDSDVRLVLDDDLRESLTGSSGDVPVVDLSKSDSDVRLVGDFDYSLRPDSDSDVKLVNPMMAPGSDSDVKLVKPSGTSSPRNEVHHSDSEVRLAPLSEVGDYRSGGRSNMSSDSDVALLPSSFGSDITGMNALDPNLIDDSIGGSALFDQADGDDAIVLPGDSGLRLSGDSGIQLRQPADSGILLEGHDSGLRLGGDSAIRLGGDSGFRLAPNPGSSAIKRLKSGSSASSKADSGIRLKGNSSVKLRKGQVEDLDSTSPMLLAQDDDDLNSTTPMLMGGSGALSGTDLEIPNLDGTQTMDLNDDNDAVVMFDDDESDDDAHTIIKKGGKKTLDESSFDLDEDDELEVSDEVLGEDDEFEDLDAFDSDDDEFDESFETGASQIGFGRRQDKVVVPQEPEWGTGFFLGLWGSTAVLVLGAMIAVDLLRSTWAGDQSGKIFDGGLIKMFTGLFSG